MMTAYPNSSIAEDVCRHLESAVLDTGAYWQASS
jgi:hypothetical protein